MSSKQDREQKRLQMQAALSQFNAGNEAPLRELTLGGARYVVQLNSVKANIWDKSQGALYSGRKRKFSNPVFVTPHGLIQCYPEQDQDLFLDSDSALNAIKKYAVGYPSDLWTVNQTTLAQQLCDKHYLRWLRDVKELPDGVEYKEARRSLSECYEVYTQQGLDGLRALYSKSYCFVLLKKFESEGWTVARSPISIDGLNR